MVAAGVGAAPLGGVAVIAPAAGVSIVVDAVGGYVYFARGGFILLLGRRGGGMAPAAAGGLGAGWAAAVMMAARMAKDASPRATPASGSRARARPIREASGFPMVKVLRLPG